MVSLSYSVLISIYLLYTVNLVDGAAKRDGGQHTGEKRQEKGCSLL